MIRRIYVDDLRDPDFIHSHLDTRIARTYAEAIHLIEVFTNSGDDIILDLDHDLGETKTGYDIAKYIVSNHLPLLGFHLHTANPVGRQNMEQLLTHYGYSHLRY
jgi:hypothetical protein